MSSPPSLFIPTITNAHASSATELNPAATNATRPGRAIAVALLRSLRVVTTPPRAAAALATATAVVSFIPDATLPTTTGIIEVYGKTASMGSYNDLGAQPLITSHHSDRAGMMRELFPGHSTVSWHGSPVRAGRALATTFRSDLPDGCRSARSECHGTWDERCGMTDPVHSAAMPTRTARTTMPPPGCDRSQQQPAQQWYATKHSVVIVDRSAIPFTVRVVVAEEGASEEKKQ